MKIRYLYTAYDGTINDYVSIVTATRDNTSTKTFSFCIPLYEVSRISILHIWCNPEGLVDCRVNYLLKDG